MGALLGDVPSPHHPHRPRQSPRSFPHPYVGTPYFTYPSLRVSFLIASVLLIRSSQSFRFLLIRSPQSLRYSPSPLSFIIPLISPALPFFVLLGSISCLACALCFSRSAVSTIFLFHRSAWQYVQVCVTIFAGLRKIATSHQSVGCCIGSNLFSLGHNPSSQQAINYNTISQD